MLRVGTACLPTIVKLANTTDGWSSRCRHLNRTTSRWQPFNLDACLGEAFAVSGNVINYDPERQHCNVKRCNPPAAAVADSQLERSNVTTTYDVIVNGRGDVTALDYKLTDAHGGWDVYAIFGKMSVVIIGARSG